MLLSKNLISCLKGEIRQNRDISIDTSDGVEGGGVSFRTCWQETSCDRVVLFSYGA